MTGDLKSCETKFNLKVFGAPSTTHHLPTNQLRKDHSWLSTRGYSGGGGGYRRISGGEAVQFSSRSNVLFKVHNTTIISLSPVTPQNLRTSGAIPHLPSSHPSVRDDWHESVSSFPHLFLSDVNIYFVAHELRAEVAGEGVSKASHKLFTLSQ